MSKVEIIGTEETFRIYNIKMDQQVIKRPSSIELIAKFKLKLKEYKRRIKEEEKGWQWTIDAAYKAMILESLLNLPEGGKITLDEMDKKGWEELVNGEMNVACITHMEFLLKAWLIIYSYINEPENLVGGTGLPKTI